MPIVLPNDQAEQTRRYMFTVENKIVQSQSERYVIISLQWEFTLDEAQAFCLDTFDEMEDCPPVKNHYFADPDVKVETICVSADMLPQLLILAVAMNGICAGKHSANHYLYNECYSATNLRGYRAVPAGDVAEH